MMLWKGSPGQELGMLSHSLLTREFREFGVPRLPLFPAASRSWAWRGEDPTDLQGIAGG